MTHTLNLMVFTDLDGTLIDHDTYKWAAAEQALTALQNVSAAVVLSSSKTAAEVSAIRSALQLEQWPAIVENGAGILQPHAKSTADSTQYDQLRAALADLPLQLHSNFRGFGDVTTAQLAGITGLPADDAMLAKQRAFSEPGEWHGSTSEKRDFLAQLQKHGITAQQGGRFLTLSYGRNKVDQMRHIIETYQPRHTVALGDAPNDVQMLEYAEFGVVVANPHRTPLPPLQNETKGQITRTTLAGPLGWNIAILDLLNRLKLH